MTEEKETVTIKKTTYQKMLVGGVVLLVAFAFVAGYVIGGAGTTGRATGTTGGTIQQQQPAQQQPSQPTAPSRAQVSLDDDPKKGDANAKVVMIEFSDFQCPFCGRFFDQTLPQVENEYINTGKVLFVYRDFPLDSIHPNARPAANAAECADEQGKFWEYHDKLFKNQASLSDASYKAWAVELGLNTAQFNSCFDSKKYDDEISKDFQDGVSVGVSGTPTFYIGNPQKGYVQLVGAQPYNVIKSAIEQELTS